MPRGPPSRRPGPIACLVPFPSQRIPNKDLTVKYAASLIYHVVGRHNTGMTTEAYIPSEVTYDGQPVDDVFAVTLYDPDSDDPHGALTTQSPLEEGQRGPLVILGTRDGRSWRVTLPEIEVYRRTVVGCEFTILGGVVREPLRAD